MKGSRVRLSGYCRELQLILKAEPEPACGSRQKGDSLSDVPVPAGDFWHRSDFRNAISLCSRAQELISSLTVGLPVREAPSCGHLCATQMVQPASRMSSDSGPHGGGPKSPMVPGSESCSLSRCLLSVQHSSSEAQTADNRHR